MLNKARQIFRALPAKRRLVFLISAAVFLISFTGLIYLGFLKVTEPIPVKGGSWREGSVGQPTAINPVFPDNDIDRNIAALIFAKLGDLAEIKPDETGREWTVRLQEGLKWQDGEKITSDDIIFTVNTINDPDSRSPLLQSFSGAIPSRVSELEMKFTLPASYVFFQESLAKLRIIPAHIFGNIPASNFYLSRFILEPVGSGPYKFASFDKKNDGFITEYRLTPNENYSGSSPYLQDFTFRFFTNEDDLIGSFNRGSIDGALIDNPANLEKIRLRHRIVPLTAPRYFAVFMNRSLAEILQDLDVRKLLNQSIDREKIVADVLAGLAEPINGPLENVELTVPKQTFLEGAPELTLSYPKSPVLEKVAEELRTGWLSVGLKLNLAPMNTSEILEAIHTRNYQLLLFGNDLNDPTDWYSFWHSSKELFPGANLSRYKSSTADRLMERIRAEQNPDRRTELLAALKQTIEKDVPAFFLYSPDYIYLLSSRLHGFDQTSVITADDRFDGVENWYAKTARKFRSSDGIEKTTGAE